MTLKKFFRALVTLLLMSVVIFLIKKSTANDNSQENYPSRAIKLIVPFKPGGGSDRIARVVDDFTEKEFGRKFIFQYKEGGGGHLGIGFGAMARPDGYTLMTYNTPDVALGPITGAGKYSLDELEFVGQIAFDPVVIVTGKKKGDEFIYKDLKDFLAKAAKQPGKLTMGISGAKGGTDLACRDMLDRNGGHVEVVLFSSGSELASAVLGGQVDAGAAGLTPFLGSIDSVKVLATTGKDRHSKAPEAPTMAEQGIKMNIGVGRVFMTQKGVPEDKLKRIKDGLKNIFEDDEFKDKMRKIGKEPTWADGAEVKKNMLEFSKNAAELIKKHYGN